VNNVSIYTVQELFMPTKHLPTRPKGVVNSITGKINPRSASGVKVQSKESLRLDPDVRRQQILEAAISYFAEAGFGGQTRELSKRIGVTQSLLYRYYPSKQDLIEAVFDAVFLKPWDPHWIKSLKNRSQPLRERLIGFYGEYAKTAYRPEWIRIYMHAGLAGMGLNRNYLQIVRTRLLHVMCKELRHGLFGHEPALAKARITERELEMVWNLHGSMFYWAVRRNIFSSAEGSDFDQRSADAVDLFLAGAAALYPSLISASKGQKIRCAQTPMVQAQLLQKTRRELR
jgi:AcrR family transcriptional regulator